MESLSHILGEMEIPWQYFLGVDSMVWPNQPIGYQTNGIWTIFLKVTPVKFNMEPKNHPTEKENHLPNLHFQVPC